MSRRQVICHFFTARPQAEEKPGASHFHRLFAEALLGASGVTMVDALLSTPKPTLEELAGVSSVVCRAYKGNDGALGYIFKELVVPQLSSDATVSQEYLMWAARLNQKDIITSHLEQVSNQVDFVTTAISHGHTELGILLLPRLDDVNALNSKGRSPLVIAAREGDVDAAEALLAAGADVNRDDHLKSSPLAAAAVKLQVGMVKFLLDHHACITKEMFDSERSYASGTISLALRHCPLGERRSEVERLLGDAVTAQSAAMTKSKCCVVM
ncbi:MAG: ankyrin repeat domain-containing protein [Coxiellaceae bacterium]|nr:ankyrin repeat domain-containing protein [Coxiellaceae bacterium]